MTQSHDSITYGCVIFTSGINDPVSWCHQSPRGPPRVTMTSINMAGECGLVENKIDRFEVERICVLPDPVNLRDHLLNRSEPALFHGAASQWECAAWTPEFLAARLGELRTNFRLFSRSHGNSGKSTVMETDCEFESATFTEFIQWLNGCMERSGRLSRFHK